MILLLATIEFLLDYFLNKVSSINFWKRECRMDQKIKNTVLGWSPGLCDQGNWSLLFSQKKKKKGYWWFGKPWFDTLESGLFLCHINAYEIWLKTFNEVRSCLYLRDFGEFVKWKIQSACFGMQFIWVLWFSSVEALNYW